MLVVVVVVVVVVAVAVERDVLSRVDGFTGGSGVGVDVCATKARATPAEWLCRSGSARVTVPLSRRTLLLSDVLTRATVPDSAVLPSPTRIKSPMLILDTSTTAIVIIPLLTALAVLVLCTLRDFGAKVGAGVGHVSQDTLQMRCI